MFGAPQPRYRIYTTPDSYLTAIPGALIEPNGDADRVNQLEQEIARRVGSRFAVATPTARTGIYLTLAALIKPGQKVLLSPLTIVDVINMVICAGGTPQFIDIEKNTGNIDASEIEKQIDENTGAVLVTHLHGLACDIERIRAICDRAGVPLVEDAAQSFSTRVKNKWTGTFGRAGIFSFGMYKVVNSFYGGMVVTHDEGLYRTLRERVDAMPYMRSGILLHKALFALATDISTSALPFGLFTYWFFRHGYLKQIDAILDIVTVDRHPQRRLALSPDLLCRMRPAQAQLIMNQLDGVEANNEARIRAAQRYDAGLRTLSQIILPPMRTDGSHLYTYYPVRFPDRHAFMRYAFERRRDMVLSHYHNTASLKIFADFTSPCPNAEATARELVYLPSYPRYKTEQIDRNIEVIHDFFKRS